MNHLILAAWSFAAFAAGAFTSGARTVVDLPPISESWSSSTAPRAGHPKA